jgi:hypothetical protein
MQSALLATAANSSPREQEPRLTLLGLGQGCKPLRWWTSPASAS